MPRMSALYKAVTTSVGRFVPARLQPFYNHPAGISGKIVDRMLRSSRSCNR